jgi:hypothetical protein
MRKLLLFVSGLFFFLCPLVSHAQVSVAPMCQPRCQFFYANGLPLAAGKVFTDITGTSTPLGSYTDNTGSFLNQNPLILDSGGFGDLWLISGNVYRIVVQDMTGVQQYLRDGIVGIGGSAGAGSANWSALLPGTNSNAGTFIASGNGWDFGAATLFKVLAGAGCSPSAIGSLCYDTAANKWVFNQNGAATNFGVASPGACAANQWVNSPATATAAAGCAQVSFSNLAGAAVAGQLPGSGVTTINGTGCTIGSSCTPPAETTISSAGNGSSSLNNTGPWVAGRFYLVSAHTLLRLYAVNLVAGNTGCVGSATVAFYDFTASAAVSSISIGNLGINATIDSGIISTSMTANHVFGFNTTAATSGCANGDLIIEATYQ